MRHVAVLLPHQFNEAQITREALALPAVIACRRAKHQNHVKPSLQKYFPFPKF